MRLSDMRPEARRAEIASQEQAPRLAALAQQFKRVVARQRAHEEAVLRVLDTPRAKEIILAVVTEAIQRRIGVV